MSNFHTKGTTIIAIRKGNKGVIAGDGQITLGSHVIKGTAVKVKRIKDVITGFAGSTADALTLLERLSNNLSKHSNLQHACLSMARDWRTDKYLRRLEAMILVMDRASMFLISGNGDVIEPEGGVCAIGSGGVIALAAAKACYEFVDDPADIADRAMKIAGEFCIYTNNTIIKEEIDISDTKAQKELSKTIERKK